MWSNFCSGKLVCVQTVGVAYVDVVSRRFQLCQFVDSANLVNLESVVVQLAAKECLIATSSDGDARARSLRQLLDRSNVAVTERKRGLICFVLFFVWLLYFSGGSTMTATNHDGHKPWRPQTMTATNHDGHRHVFWRR